MTVQTEELEALVHRQHSNPHAVLGAHAENGGVVIRALRPAACEIKAHVDGGETVALEQIHAGGVFEGHVPKAELPLRYQLEVDYGNAGNFTIEDPYAFGPTLGELDLHLIAEGRHEEIYEKLGAHVREHAGVTGTAFAVWAPAAQAVSVVGDFNSWDGRLHGMRSLGSTGIWEVFLPGVEAGARYKYEILAADGELKLKADPYALETEIPPKTASVVSRTTHRWQDAEWLARRTEQQPLSSPMSIYEVHLGSWRLNPLEDNRSLSYLELADELSAYVKDMGFTHVELLPVMAHPFTGSWGYQVTGYFAPTPRFGAPDDFRQFVDRMHANGVGLILDWVPAHFPRDEFALARFDGTALYEHADPRRGAHPDWGTLVFNFGRHEVRNFLISNALFWLREYHIDGIRVDAVASMLYLDYSRRAGEWVPNEFGGREDLDAVAFLKELNEVIYGREPGIVSAAEESTAWPGVSRPTYLGGLGFGFKWNMGWMHDTLALLPAGPDLPPLPPPRAHLQPDVRVQRELHPAALPRRGRARQGLAVQQDAGRPLAEAREPAHAVCLHVGTPGQEAAVHGLGVRPGGRVEREPLARLAPARDARARRHPGARARPQPALQVRAGAVGGRRGPERVLVARAKRRRQQRDRVRPPIARRRAGRGVRGEPVARAAQPVPAWAAAHVPVERGDQHRLDLLRRQRHGQSRRRGARADPVARSTSVGRDHAAPPRRHLARAR